LVSITLFVFLPGLVPRAAVGVEDAGGGLHGGGWSAPAAGVGDGKSRRTAARDAGITGRWGA